jgi:hypothetical protein
MNQNKKKVVILGGGVAGLMAAHQLAKHGDYDIELYERNDDVGGQARAAKHTQSFWTDEPNDTHTEYCWHAIGRGYMNFLPLLAELPNYRQDEKNPKLVKEYNDTVLDHVVPLDKFVYCQKNRPVYIEKRTAFLTDTTKFWSGYRGVYGERPSIKDIMRLAYIFLRANTICRERLESYDTILWSDAVKPFSANIRRWILDSTSIYFGMDYARLSKYFMYHLIRQNVNSDLVDPNYTFFSFDGPMTETFFFPWKFHLKKMGVKIFVKHEVKAININCDNTIQNVEINVRSNCDLTIPPKIIHADIFISALPAEILAKLYPVFPLIESSFSATETFMKSSALATEQMRFAELAMRGHQIQTQVLYYIPHRVEMDSDELSTGTVVIFHDTPWFLMIRIEGGLWDLPDYHDEDGNDIANINEYDLLSTGIGMWDVPGLFGKTAVQCTREELAAECWAQIQSTQHNFNFDDFIPKWDIWNSFQFDEKKRKINTWEPKWSNSAYTLNLRPTPKDKNITNLYHCGAIFKGPDEITNKNVFNMEGACFSAKVTTDIIHFGEIKDPVLLKGYESPNVFVKICRFFDKFVYKIGRRFKKKSN